MKKKHVHVQRALGGKIINVLVSYGKTQFILMLAVTGISWILLTRIGVQFPLLLAIMTGSLSIVPVLGMTVAGIVVSTIAIFDTVRFLPGVSVLFEGVMMVVVYGLLNVVIDYFLSPYLVGQYSGVHPVMLLVFVVIGTLVFGVWGALFTVPAVLVAKTISEHYAQ